MKSQAALLLIFHLTLDVTLTVVKLVEAALGFHAVVLKLSVGAPPWVTLMVRTGTPGACTVIRPVLAGPWLTAAFS